jgi:hypothetical protein
MVISILNNNWNFGKYNTQDQDHLIRESVNYLEALIRPFDPDYKVVAYKGGSWGLQPSGDLLRNMEKHGIKIIMGVRKGMHLSGNGVDYRNLEEPTMPYHPDYNDLNKISAEEKEIIVIPLQTVTPGIKGLTYLAMDLLKRKISRKDDMRHFYENPIPTTVKKLSPISKESGPKFPFINYQTHLKIGNQPFNYLKASFDQMIKRLSKTTYERIPILIECHTKQFNNYYHDIEKFLVYILEKYGDIVEFNTLSEFLKEMQSQKNMVKVKSKQKLTSSI